MSGFDIGAQVKVLSALDYYHQASDWVGCQARVVTVDSADDELQYELEREGGRRAWFGGRQLQDAAPVGEAPPDPADYCGECGQPLTRCQAWQYGDHREVDLL
ncbi:MAG TPA: hypothetical protein VL551_22530 [Actinospica sp.]|jgi:hypothetical protein|nr:hypothetical protein [Actinospica sp.]